MKVINSGLNFELYGDDLKTFDKLPAYTYTIKFSKMVGFYLERTSDIEVGEPKVYGIHKKKVEKVLSTFSKVNRNLGVILSGDKGIGKSLFVRLLAEEGKKKDLPIIIVEKYIPNIAAYISKIDQEAVFIFDEFDKTFGNVEAVDGEVSPQDSMLTLFDGIFPGKKLFIITCNNLNNVSDYLVNRPGRFHYHFRFGYPNSEEIRKYMIDKLDPKYIKEIDEIISFSYKVPLNYDCLRAIAFEINLGENFKDAIKDLNIVNTETHYYTVLLHFKEGEVFDSRMCDLDLFSADEVNFEMYDISNDYYTYVAFSPKEIIFDLNIGKNIIPIEKCKITFSADECDKEKVDAVKKLHPDYVEIKPSAQNSNIHYF